MPSPATLAGPVNSQNSSDGSARKTHRVEMFSDAVLAIAITLPIVDLHAPEVPEGGSLLQGYLKLSAGYQAYALSFVVIGLYWAHSHFSGKIIRKTDHVFNLLTLVFLALVSITPFPSRPLVEHWNDAVNLHTAASVYTGVLAAPALAWLARWGYAVAAGLLDPRLTQAYVRRVTRKYAWTAVVAVLGCGLALLVNGKLGFVVSLLVVLSYLLAPIAPQYRPGQEPADELEEPDEAPVQAH